MRDPSDLSDRELDQIIANHEAKGATGQDLYGHLIAERDQRRGAGLSMDTSLELLIQAAREGRFVAYGELAAASNVPWSKARRQMNGPSGHLQNILAVCAARGWPLLSAIVTDRNNLDSGAFATSALEGFARGARQVGYAVVDDQVFLEEQQRATFRWAQARSTEDG